MNKLLPILFMSILLSGELEVDGDLKVTGTIQSADSLNQRIVELELIIVQLQAQIALLEFKMAFLVNDLGYGDCMGVLGGDAVEDSCGICGGDGTSCIVEDYDENIYYIIDIGEQVWMAENLKVTHYRDGSDIPYNDNANEWSSLNTGASCSFGNSGGGMIETYGLLYNGYAVNDDRGLCMDGWHVPSDDDLKELEMYLGMSPSEADDTAWRGTNEGSKLAGSAYLWNNGDLDNNQEFGTSSFNVLPGGYRSYSNGTDYMMTVEGYLWSSSDSNSSNAWARNLLCSNSGIYRDNYDKGNGFSVRCIKD